MSDYITLRSGGDDPMTPPKVETSSGMWGYLFGGRPLDEFADSNEAESDDPDHGDRSQERPQWGQKWAPEPPTVPEGAVIEGFSALCKAGQVKGLSKDALVGLWDSVDQFIKNQIQAAAATKNTDLTVWWKEVNGQKQLIEGGFTGASSQVSAKWFADLQKYVEQKAKNK